MIYTIEDSNRIVARKNADDPRPYRGSFRAVMNTGGAYFLGCCGMAGLENFNYAPPIVGFADEANFMALMYRHFYKQGTVVYALTGAQLGSVVHQLFLKVGAKEVAVFPNMYHGAQMVHLFLINVRNICGRYCDKYGQAYAEPPKDEADVIPEQTDPTLRASELRDEGLDNATGWYNGVYYVGGFANLPQAGA